MIRTRYKKGRLYIAFTLLSSGLQSSLVVKKKKRKKKCIHSCQTGLLCQVVYREVELINDPGACFYYGDLNLPKALSTFL